MGKRLLPSRSRAARHAPAWICALAMAAPAFAAGAYDGPFAEPSPLFLHMPPFDRIGEGDYRPAFAAGMAQQLAEVAAIAANPEPPTFENTIVALERSGQLLNRVNAVFGNLTGANTNPEHDAIDAEMSPKLAAHNDAILLDPALFARVRKIYETRATLGLDPESLRLVERYYILFTRGGAALDEAGKAGLRAINEELSSVGTRFDQALLKANSDGAVLVDRKEDLEGFTPEQTEAAAQAARERHHDGQWAIALQRPTGQDALASLANRALRERIYRASVARGAGGPDDTSALVVRTAQLRARKAALLGYANWADYVERDETAGAPAAVDRMLASVAPATLANMRREAADLQKEIDDEAKAARRPSFRLQPWDWAYYAERLRRKRFHFDDAELRPYFEVDRVVHDGLFYAANRLYGLAFKERKDLPVYQPDVRVFEVFDADGSPLALIVMDYFARPNKQGGAWMNEYVTQSRLLGLRPVVGNHLNLVKPAPGQPALMTLDDVKTAFHEFGHGLHGMLSSVEYPMFGGTNNSPHDFVEYPSQFNEMWGRDAEVLAHMARHYQTDAPIPADLLEQVLAARKFDQGFVTGELVEAMVIDQAWHEAREDQLPKPADIPRFEAAALKRAGLDFAPVPPRYHSTYFAHIFGNSSGYSADYYAYLWSEVLARDTEQWMKLHGGLERANGDFLRAKVLSRGSSEAASRLFQEFYGAAPDVRPLLEFHGLAAAPTPAPSGH
jgi:peptidyl-dipeptidase Dcp